MSSQLDKFQKLKSSWNQYSNLSVIQQSQRVQDIENLVQVIDAKISADTMFTIAKQKVLEEGCDEMRKQIEQLRVIYTRINQEQKQNIEYFNLKCQQGCQQAKNAINIDKDEFQKISEDKINKIKQTVAEECQTSIQETNSQKKQIIGCKNFVQQEMRRFQKSQSQSLNKFYKKANEEISQISYCLQMRKLQKKQKMVKLQIMCETIFNQLNKTLHKQQKIGQLTYQSLLKLIEDFYFYMRTNNGLH